MAKKHVIATSANDKEIYTYLIQTAVARQISRQPHLVTLIKEVVKSLNLTTPHLMLEQDMGRTVGYSEQLETRENDAIFYAKQSKSEVYTRFVKNRKTNPTSFLCIVLNRDEDGDYELTSVWVGKMFPPIPGTEHATDQSKAYWADHAVVYNGQPILSSTQTKDCPY